MHVCVVWNESMLSSLLFVMWIVLAWILIFILCLMPSSVLFEM